MIKDYTTNIPIITVIPRCVPQKMSFSKCVPYIKPYLVVSEAQVESNFPLKPNQPWELGGESIDYILMCVWCS